MALNNKITKEIDGFTGTLVANDCYIRVDSISASKQSVTCYVVFISNDATIGRASYSFAPNMTGENFIKQSYLHLKTLPEFADATDV
jgi:hypothetical protein